MDQAISNPTAWVSQPRAARMLGVGTRTVRRLVAEGALTTRQLPGCHPRVLVEDVLTLLLRSVMPARR